MFSCAATINLYASWLFLGGRLSLDCGRDAASAALSLTVSLGAGASVLERAFKLLVQQDGYELGDADRAAAWAALLRAPRGVEGDGNAASIASCTLDLPNQRVVVVDAERTRAEVESFRSPRVQSRLVRCLTFFVKNGYRYGLADRSSSPFVVRYRQGLNELLAALLMLDCELSDAAIMATFSRLVCTFAPRYYVDTDDESFVAVQCSLRLFTLLLCYHDCELVRFLEQHGCSAELFATPWLVTLFARSLARAELFALFDLLIGCAQVPGPAILHFVAVAFVLSHRERILASKTCGVIASELPLLMSRLAFSSVAHVRLVFASALRLFVDTPRSLREKIESVCYFGPRLSRVSSSLLESLEERLCVGIEANELAETSLQPPAVERLLSLLLDDRILERGPRHFILDVRSAGEFRWSGRLPTAFHLDEALLIDPENLGSTLRTLSGLSSCHFALIGPADRSRAFAAMFLQRGFKRVSEVEGGFASFHQRYKLRLNELLVGHEPSLCTLCSDKKAIDLLKGLSALERGGALMREPGLQPRPVAAPRLPSSTLTTPAPLFSFLSSVLSPLSRHVE